MTAASAGASRAAVVLAAMVLGVAGCSLGSTTPSPSPSVSRSSAPSQFPAPGTAPLPAGRVQALQAVLQDAVDQWAVSHQAGGPGVTAALLSDHGAWAGAAGVDGAGKKLTPEAMMMVASISKTFAAAEVMLLSQAGKIDLDTPLSTYLPDPLTQNGATVRQVLGMRSGVSEASDARYQTLIAEALAACDTHWTARQTLNALAPTASAPGGKPVYANANYLLLALAVEKLTGHSLAELERSDLFEPAGLTRIAAQDTEPALPPLAAPPSRLKITPDGYLPCRSIASSGEDSMTGVAADAASVARWGYQLYGARVLDGRSVALMTTPATSEELSPGVQYGLGSMVFTELTTDPAYGHRGATVGYSSLLVVVPARRLSVAVMIPEENSNLDPIMRQLLALAS